MKNSSKKTKIGVLGGTFNPIHNAHIELGKAAKEQLGLDKVLFMPNYTPPHKAASLPSNEIRVKMIEEAIAGYDGFELSLCEINRGGVSYMVDTLPILQQQFPDAELYLIIGGDSYADFNKWVKPDEIKRMCTLAVYPRPGYPEPNDDTITFKVEESTLSSTQIRNAVHDGKDVSTLVPKAVNKIILQENLYK